MHPLPHVYQAAAAGSATDNVSLNTAGVPTLTSASPVEFGGPGDQWSPETLLCAALAGCFILTFRAVARASRIEWQKLECRVEGVLERKDGAMRFTRCTTYATLTVPSGANREQCMRAMEKAEQGCLIANSLQAERGLNAEVVMG